MEEVIKFHIDDIKRMTELTEKELMRVAHGGRYFDIVRKGKEILIEEVL